MNRWQQQFDSLSLFRVNIKRAPFVFYLSSLVAFALACSCHTVTDKKKLDRKKKFTRLLFHSEMNDRRKLYRRKDEKKKREREREKAQKERTRRTFFFCLLPKCSIRLLSPSASQKKMERIEKSCSTVVAPLILSIVCSSSPPSVPFFFSLSLYVYVRRAFDVCKYINTNGNKKIEKKRRRRKKAEKEKEQAENEWKTHELFYSRFLVLC